MSARYHFRCHQFIRDGENVLIETDADLVTQAHYTDFLGMWDGLSSKRRGSQLLRV